MKPKYIYPIVLTFNKGRFTYTHFYLTREEAQKEIEEHELEDSEIRDLKPGTEFCTDFDTEDGIGLYTCKMIEVSLEHHSMNFFCRIPFKIDPDRIKWYGASYIHQPAQDNYSIILVEYVVNGPTVSTVIEESIPLHRSCSDMNPEDVLRKYIKRFYDTRNNSEKWLKEE